MPMPQQKKRHLILTVFVGSKGRNAKLQCHSPNVYQISPLVGSIMTTYEQNWSAHAVCSPSTPGLTGHTGAGFGDRIWEEVPGQWWCIRANESFSSVQWHWQPLGHLRLSRIRGSCLFFLEITRDRACGRHNRIILDN